MGSAANAWKQQQLDYIYFLLKHVYISVIIIAHDFDMT